MKLLYVLDLGSLGCWRSLAATRQLAEETGVELSVLPLTRTLGNVADDSKGGSDDPLAVYKARRARARNLSADAELRRNCDAMGISHEAGGRSLDTNLVSRAMLQLPEASARLDFAERCYRAHFAEAKNLADPAEVDRLLATSLSVSADELADVAEELTERGVFSAPAYVLDTGHEEPERFHGRQHLPLVRWMIEGRKGTPPV